MQSFGSLAVTEQRHRMPVTGGAARIRLETCIARSADAVLAGTSAQASELIRMGVPRAAVTVVPDGVDTGRFSPDGPAADRGERPRLLTVAPLDDGQGLDVLVRMLCGVPEAELVVAGGPPRAQLRNLKAYRTLMRQARSLGVASRLSFTGEVSPADLPALLRSADLLVSAAPYDPHGVITLAAMACGTPVAVSAVGSNRDAVLDETTGLLVAPGRPGLLAQRVRRLLAAPMRLEAFGIAAADRASARYSWDRIGRETAAAYQRCLPPVPRPRRSPSRSRARARAGDWRRPEIWWRPWPDRQPAAKPPASRPRPGGGVLHAYGRGSRTTVRKKSSICRTAAMNRLALTGLVTNALACSL